MDDDVLLSEVSEGVATLTLNRPAALNALSMELRAKLVAAFKAMDARDDVRAIVLTGRGRAFCAGLDVKELATSGANVTANVGAADIGGAIAGVRKPIIAAINGLAVTGGFEITLCCDIVIAAHSAWFQDTHMRVGLLPGWGLSQRLPRVAGPYRAKEISLSGRKVSAEEAERLGFVVKIVDDDVLIHEARALARSMAQYDCGLLQMMKSLIDRGYALPFGEALALEITESKRLNSTVTIATKA